MSRASGQMPARLRHLDIARVDIVGYSAGGSVALRHPGLVAQTRRRWRLAQRRRSAGLAAFAQRSEAKSRTCSYERARPVALDPELESLLRANRAVFAFHQAQPPNYQRKVVHWIMGAKGADTGRRRLGPLLAACAQGRRL